MSERTGRSSSEMARRFGERLTLVLQELHTVLSHIESESLDHLHRHILAAQRIYLSGYGRSGLVARALAMRLMHLGLRTYVVGETVTPAIRAGDVLICFSRSGHSPALLEQVQRVDAVGARVVAITTSANNPLAQQAHVLVCLSTGDQTDVKHFQYAGTLFEQSALVFSDILVGLLQRDLQLTDADLDTRHANLQ